MPHGRPQRLDVALALARCEVWAAAHLLDLIQPFLLFDADVKDWAIRDSTNMDEDILQRYVDREHRLGLLNTGRVQVSYLRDHAVEIAMQQRLFLLCRPPIFRRW